MVFAVPTWRKLKNNGLTHRSNPRIAWNQKIANECSTFFIYIKLIKTRSHHSFFALFPFFFLTDIDECKTYLNKCHVNATCNNTYGSHVCTCKPGYTGDGRNCTGTINNLRSFHICFDYYSNFCLLLLFSLFVCLFACFNTVESQDLIFVT